MSARSPLRIAVVDRDRGFLAVLRKRLERIDWSYRVRTSGLSPSKIASMDLDAVVVDLAAVGPGHWTWLTRLCREAPGVAVVICAAGSTPTDRVRAVRLGADDWLPKPCHPEELIARIEAVVRTYRSRASAEREPTRVGELEIHGRYQVAVVGRPLRLTRRECQVLELLVEAGEVVLEPKDIYKRIWGHAMRREDRSVDVFVHKLRRKLEQASPEWRYIHTHRGRGYELVAERRAAPVHPLPDRQEESSSVAARLAA